jgi:hypothetical protein
MKNIHLLPTNKPSRLGYLTKGRLKLFGQLIPNIIDIENQHIYITSDEEIKEGDWCIEYDDIDKKWLSPYKPNNESWDMVSKANYCRIRGTVKKIILTTDQDLIADSVQAIDDTFLEWFVKNLSCEYVEVQRDKCLDTSLMCDCVDEPCRNKGYKIIIPQKEPVNPNNQEVMFHEEHKEYFYEDFIDGKFVTVWLGKDYIPQEEPKQETLEEAVNAFKKTDVYINEIKQQEKRMYSEEEVYDILFKHTEYFLSDGERMSLTKWFERYKKK